MNDQAAPPVTTAAGQPSPYAELIKEYQASELARIASIEQRGLAVITTSGALVTLLFGLAALVTKAQGYQVPALSVGLLLGSLLGFLLAAVLAIQTNAPLHYDDLDAARLDRIQLLREPVDKTHRKIFRLRVKVLASLQHLAEVKATRLQIAVWAEVAAVTLVALAIAVILIEA